jgi:hypothetical protein
MKAERVASDVGFNVSTFCNTLCILCSKLTVQHNHI